MIMKLGVLFVVAAVVLGTEANRVGPACSELQITSDSVSCSYTEDRTVCSVQCDDRDNGEYTCTEEKGWSPELPSCARPTEDELDEEYPLNARCNARRCSEWCQQHKKSGKCVGNKCRCSAGFPFLTDDDEVVSAGCNPRRCKEWCEQHKKSGSCVGKKCKCS